MDLTGFWATIQAQLTECQQARSADDVLRILATAGNPYDDPSITGAPAFFAGSGGDESLMAALEVAGWTVVWAEAHYHYAMRAPDGSAITYVEGDIYRYYGGNAMRFIGADGEDGPPHADYPHEPGRLYDCAACEASCHCVAGYTQCVYRGEHNGLADDGNETFGSVPRDDES